MRCLENFAKTFLRKKIRVEFPLLSDTNRRYPFHGDVFVGKFPYDFIFAFVLARKIFSARCSGSIPEKVQRNF